MVVEVPVHPVNYQDTISNHLYQNGFLKGLYSDLLVRVKYQGPHVSSIEGVLFKLHKIIVMRSPLIAGLLINKEENGE